MDSRADIEAMLARAAAILREEGAEAVYAFGSLARGGGDDDSDLDLAVAGLPADRLLPALARLVTELGRMADLLRTEHEPAFVRYLDSRGELRRVA